MHNSRRVAFSLVEALVVIGLIGVLVGLLMPAVQNARNTALRTECLNRLKQIGVALHGFHNLRGRLPDLPLQKGDRRHPDNVLGWMAHILPLMGEEALYRTSAEACRRDSLPWHNPPHVGFATVVPGYICPADGRLLKVQRSQLGGDVALTSYIGIRGVRPPGARVGFHGAFGGGPRLTQFPDGASNTVMVGERPPPNTFEAGWWYPNLVPGGTGPSSYLLLGATPRKLSDGCRINGERVFGPGRTDNVCDRFHFWSLHGGGGNFLFADGSARFLPYSAESLIFSLASRNGGESVIVPH